MLVPSTAADVPALVDCLSVSFADDPVVQWFLRQDGGHDAAQRLFFEHAVARMTLPHGWVRHVEEHRGVALWAPPGTWDLGLRQQLALLGDMVRIVSMRSLPRVLAALHVLEAHHPPGHVYLSFLCTRPEHRGRGLGRQLLEPMCERCDQEGLPIYLENTKPVNEGFYRRFGFEPLHDLLLPGASDMYYLGMARYPT
jgi:GNAT superfamily N-acetyltransferase